MMTGRVPEGPAVAAARRASRGPSGTRAGTCRVGTGALGVVGPRRRGTNDLPERRVDKLSSVEQMRCRPV